MTFRCRVAGDPDLPGLARIWSDGWNDAHRHLMPPEVVAARTPESFVRRLAEGLPDVRVIEDEGGLAGFHYIRCAELYQFYVSSRVRGKGLAQKLMADAEESLRKTGVLNAWLACAIGNDRAARFYSRAGWVLAGTFDYILLLPDGPHPLRAWRFEKSFDGGDRIQERND